MLPDQKQACRASTLTELLRLRVCHQPHQMAFTFLGASPENAANLTYRELGSRAQAISGALRGIAGTGDRALMLYPAGLDYVCAFFGCLYAGVIAVPSYPPDPARLSRTLPRLEAIIADARPRVVLTTTPLLSSLKPRFGLVPALNELQWIATDRLDVGSPQGSEESAVTADDLALLQYTSGSTGTPRGVMLTHGNLLHNAALVYNGVQHEPGDSYVSWLPVSHDMGFMAGVLQPVYGGFPVVLMSPLSFLQNPVLWLETITRYRATTSGGPNFAYELCARKVTPQQCATLDLSSWKVAFNGSEPIRCATLENFATAFEGCGFRREAFYPCYGLAEATLIVSGGARNAAPVINVVDASALEKSRVRKASANHQKPRPLVGCGKSLLNQTVVIADPESMTECAPDHVGEIWVSGPSVARGYWNRPEETEKTFDAYLSDVGHGPFLRTGDLGFLSDGELFVTGRLKDLIIIRGLNYYPQDIELTVERSHDALRPGCVAAFSLEGKGEERLAIVAEVEQDRPADLDQVVNTVRRAVAEHHDLQAHLVVLVKGGTIPKTSSGKIQRGACRSGLLENRLDEITRDLVDGASSSPAPQSLILKALLAIDPEKRLPVAQSYLQEQVGRAAGRSASSIPIGEPLGSLGLDSLMVTELGSCIKGDLGVALSIPRLYECSIEELTHEVLNELQMPDRPETTPLSQGGDASRYFPLSYVQKALWFYYQLAPHTGAYNIAFAARIPSEIDAAALRRALQFLIDRHPALRTTYATVDGEPAQRIRRLEVCFKHTQASDWTEDQLNGSLLDEAYRPLDLENGPLFRATLITLSPTEHVILLVVHHIAIDGWSFWLLLDELGAMYAAETKGDRADLPPLRFQYRDFVAWQQELVEGPMGEHQFEHWRKELAGELLVLDLPTVRPRPPAQTFNGASHHFQLDDELTRRLRAMASREGATLYMALLASFQAFLYRYTNQEDIVVGSPMTARTREEFQGVVGCFFNIVPLRAKLSGNLMFKELLGQVRGTVLLALEHQDYPSQLLTERLQLNRGQNLSSLFQVNFILQKPHRLQAALSLVSGESEARIHAGGLVLEPLPLEKRFARTELELELIDAGRKVLGSFQYNADIFDADTIARAANHFRTLLEAVAENPSERLSQLPVLTGAERKRLLFEWSNVGTHFSNQATVHELFEQQALRTPDKAAAVYNDSTLAFKELNTQADRLAWFIKRIRNDRKPTV